MIGDHWLVPITLISDYMTENNCLCHHPTTLKRTQSAESPAHGIPRDTWNMFFNLVEAVGDGNLSSYDDSEAWPSLFDDFIEQENDRANQNVEAVEKGTSDVE